VSASTPIHQDAGVVRAEQVSYAHPVAVVGDAAMDKDERWTAAKTVKTNRCAVFGNGDALDGGAVDGFIGWMGHAFFLSGRFEDRFLCDAARPTVEPVVISCSF
jgi:hypothetical protein